MHVNHPRLCLAQRHLLNSLGVSKLKLSRAVAEEVPIDPCGNVALYLSGDGLRGLVHGADQRRYGLQHPLLRDPVLLHITISHRLICCENIQMEKFKVRPTFSSSSHFCPGDKRKKRLKGEELVTPHREQLSELSSHLRSSWSGTLVLYYGLSNLPSGGGDICGFIVGILEVFFWLKFVSVLRAGTLFSPISGHQWAEQMPEESWPTSREQKHMT